MTLQCLLPRVSLWQSANAPPLSLPACLQGDTCSLVQTQFSLNASSFSSLNPGIDCTSSTSLAASQVLCLERDPSRLGINPPCTATHRVQRQETCDYLRSLGTQTFPDGTVSRLSWLEFYRLNPGVVCNRLTPPIGDALVGAEVR